MEGTKKSVPEIRFKGFEGEWNICNIRNISSMITKGTTPYDKSNIGDVNFIKIENIDSSSNEIINPSKISKAEHNGHLKRSRLLENDVLFSIAGTLGHVAIVKKSILPANTNQALSIIRFTTGNLNYLKYSLLSKRTSDYINRILTVGAQPNLSLEQVGNLDIFLPDLNEQKMIGNYFKELSNTIIKYKEKLKQLSTLKKVLLEKMFPKDGADVPEIRFGDFTEEWIKYKLEDIGTSYSGLSGKSKEDFGHGLAKYIPYLNIHDNPITDLKILEAIEIDNNQNKIEYGDILFTTSSETPEEVGLSSVWLGTDENIYLNSFCFGFRLKKPHSINYYCLAYLLRNQTIRDKIIPLAQGISRYNLSKTRLMKISVSLPKNKIEQELIGNYFFNLDECIHQTLMKLNKLQSLKKALLEKMFV